MASNFFAMLMDFVMVLTCLAACMSLKKIMIVDSFVPLFYSIQALADNCLNMQVLQGLDSASAAVDDMDEWLRIFNLKLRHMREDISSVCFIKIYLISCRCHLEAQIMPFVQLTCLATTILVFRVQSCSLSALTPRNGASWLDFSF